MVGSFGIPFSLGPLKFQEYNLGYNFKLPPTVEYCFHAMALDERRQTFGVTRLEGAYEVWFRGAHSDIGGGNNNVGLNNVALCWMLRKASAAGVPIRITGIEAAANSSQPNANVRWPKDLIKNARRKVGEDDLVHHTVAKSLDTDCNDPPNTCAIETREQEMLAVRARTFKAN